MYQNTNDSAPLQAGYYVKRNPTQPPMTGNTNGIPYTPSQNVNTQLMAAHNTNPHPQAFNQQPYSQGGYPQGPSPTQPTYPNQTSYDILPMGPSNNINGFSQGQKIVSILIIVLNGLFVTGITTLTFLTLFTSFYSDMDPTSIIGRSFALSFGFAIMLIRVIFVPCFGWSSNLKQQQKVALGLNFIIPALKYHIMRLNPHYAGKMLTIYRQDLIVAIYEGFVCACSLLVYDSYESAFWLILSIFCFLDMMVWIIVVIIHKPWIKQVIVIEKQRTLALLLNPLLQYQPQPYLQPYYPNNQPIYGQNQPANIQN